MKTFKKNGAIILFLLLVTFSEKSFSQNVLTYFPETNVGIGGKVQAIAITGDTVIIGGTFVTIGGITRKYLAAINIRTGIVLPLNPVINTSIWLLMVHQNKLYFNYDKNIRSIDLSDGIITNWQPKLATNNPISNPPYPTVIAAYKNNIFIAGNFDSVNGQYKRNFAVVDAFTGNNNNFYPILESNIGQANQLIIKDSILYTGVSAYNLNTGQKTSWNPNPNNATDLIYSLGNNSIYAGGAFTSIGSQLRNFIAELDLFNGNASSWNPSARGANLLCAAKSCIFVVNPNLESYDKVTGSKIDTWIPYASNSILTMASYGDTVIVGGYFSKMGWVSRNNLCAVTRGLSLGINEVNNFIQKISVFPNPASNKISFSLNETSNKTLNIIITNILGERVFNNTLNYQKEIEIPVTDLNNGIYFIKIQSGNNTYAGKFVKE